LKVLYVTYVRSKLEYANCVWQPFYVTHINRIERIQEKFTKHALRQFQWNVNIDLPPYENRCRVLVMDTLKKRRDVPRVLLVFEFLSGKIDSPKLLSQILAYLHIKPGVGNFCSSNFTERIMGFMNLSMQRRDALMGLLVFLISI
jgi:hypothetical protein